MPESVIIQGIEILFRGNNMFDKKEYMKIWREKNKEYCFEYHREWLKNNPKYIKKWNEDNPEYQKQYYQKNKEKMLV